MNAKLDVLNRTLFSYSAPPASLQVVRSPHLSSTVDDLLRSIESGCKPNSVLTKLYNLKVLAQHNDADKLEKALKELSSISAMSAGQSKH